MIAVRRLWPLGLLVAAVCGGVSCSEPNPPKKTPRHEKPAATAPGRVTRSAQPRSSPRRQDPATRSPSSDAREPLAVPLAGATLDDPVVDPRDDSTHAMPDQREWASGPHDRRDLPVGPARLLPDPHRLAAAGIRRIDGKHLVLYTDVASSVAVDELPAVFDQAIALWCEYFGVAPDRVASWQVTGALMDRKEPFQATGLLPNDLPPFLHGYQRGDAIWVYEQPSDYYRRHLVLHEGTHAFMQQQLGGCGPPWYMEGTAELLGTHRWSDEGLVLGYFPQRRAEVDHWGRIKLVRDEVLAGRTMSLEQIIAYGPSAHLRIEPYGWSWAAAAFLDGHPQFRDRFRQLPARVREDPAAFSRSFYALFAEDLAQLLEQWQLFVEHVDYGYDLVREAIIYRPALAVGSDAVTVTIAADRGWQSSGYRVEAGTRYQIEAAGRFQLATEPRIWWSEPNGVTIRYYAGRPLGELLAAVVDPSWSGERTTPLARPTPIGTGRKWTVSESGTLFLRVNDHPSELGDNAGEVQVVIRAVASP